MKARNTVICVVAALVFVFTAVSLNSLTGKIPEINTPFAPDKYIAQPYEGVIKSCDLNYFRMYSAQYLMPGCEQSVLRLYTNSGSDSAITNYWIDLHEYNTSMNNTVCKISYAEIDKDKINHLKYHYKYVRFYLAEFTDAETHKALAFEFGSEDCPIFDLSGKFYEVAPAVNGVVNRDKILDAEIKEGRGLVYMGYFLAENRCSLSDDYYSIRREISEKKLFEHPDGSYLFEKIDNKTQKCVGIRFYSVTNAKEYTMYF